MLHLCGAPSRPRHTIVVTITWTTNCLQCGFVEGVLVSHVCSDTLWRLACVANSPHTAIELTRDIFNQRLIAIDLDVTEQTV